MCECVCERERESTLVAEYSSGASSLHVDLFANCHLLHRETSLVRSEL